MSVLQTIIDRAKNAPRHIVLAEGSDPRIVEGAVRAAKDGIATITLLGNETEIRPLTQAAGDESGRIAISDPGDKDPLFFTNEMVMRDEADGSVAGAVYATPDVVRAALKVIGVADGGKLVSSFFIMIMPEDHPSLSGGVIYADCGLVVDPDAAQLADIAAKSADSGQALLGLDPQIAMLSFSTKGSAAHPSVDKMTNATDLLRANYPDLKVDGELQFDAAILPDIAARKAPGSSVAGQANVFIFPDLNSGNIAYKITERLAGAKAIGPVLQGLAKPANDLSRGCSADDIYNMIAVTVLQAQDDN